MKMTRLALKVNGNWQLFVDTTNGIDIKAVLHTLPCDSITEAMFIVRDGLDVIAIHCQFNSMTWGEKNIRTELLTLPVSDDIFAEIASQYIGWLMCMIGVDGDMLCKAYCGKREYFFTGKD